MHALLSAGDIVEFRRVLDAHEFSESMLVRQIGSAAPPDSTTVNRMRAAAGHDSPLNLLARLFLIGATVSRDRVADLLGDRFLGLCERSGLVVSRDGRSAATVVISPVEGLLFASDAFRAVAGGDAEFVLPASTQASTTLRLLTLRSPVDRCLDLGCGCGVQALIAARFARQVVATDISRRALDYTRFNCLLNGIENVECREGSLFEPVRDERFGLIICNPPFVIGPSDRWSNRGNPLELDALCSRLLAQAPDRLVEGGTLQLLCEWSEIDGESWQDRVTSALAGQHCDLLVLHGAAVLPADYVGHRAAAIRAEDEAADRGDAAWDRYLEERSVVAVHPGMVVLKRRSEPGWTHWVDLRAAPDGQSARVLGQYMETLDFLTLCEDDEILLESVVAVAPGIAMAHGQAGADGLLRLERREGLPIAVDVDRAGIAFLELMDGERTLADCVDGMTGRTAAPVSRLRPELLQLTRRLLRAGVLAPCG